MADNATSPAGELTAARDREQQIKASVISLFRHCEQGQNPILAFSRACSKVGYLARDGVRGHLFYLESALNEHKHALLAHRYQEPAEVRKHITQRDRDLQSFGAAVRRELLQPREPSGTPELRERIHRNLGAGQWSRARSDLELLSKRPDIGRPLPPLFAYPRSSNLHDEHYGVLQERIDRCNAAARSLEHRPVAAGRPGSDPCAAVGERREHQHTTATIEDRCFGPPRSLPPHGVTPGARQRSAQLEAGKDRGLGR